MKQFLLVAHNCFNLKVNVLQGEFTCIWAGTLKGFPFKTSHVYQMLEPELHSSVTKTKPLKTNELDHFIDSETSIKTKCFQGCYFQHWHGLCQRSKCCISHPAIELNVHKDHLAMAALGRFKPKCTGIWKQSAVLKTALKVI